MQNKRTKTPRPYDYKRCYNYCIWLLGRKAYTKAQLRDKLKKKEAQPEDIDKVIAKLEHLNFIDDALFAENFVRTRKSRKGSIALKQELRLKGIANELIDETLEPLDQDSEVKAATGVLEKATWRLLKAEPQKRYSKAYAFLARRGFPGDVVKLALENIALTDEDT